MDFVEWLFGPGFMPHGHCYQWTPGIVWSHVISDAIIALSYYSIPIVLLTLLKRRNDLAFRPVFGLFGVFIIACGTGHALDIWNIWHGAYWLSAIVRTVTALVSLVTAIVLWPMLPVALRIPSPSRLHKEIEERKAMESQLLLARDRLEKRVEGGDEELERLGLLSVGREEQMIELKKRVNELCAEAGRPAEFNLDFEEELDSEGELR